MTTPITITKAPEQIIREAHFNRALFDAANEAHGYNVIIERALKCPCKSSGTDNLSSCRNCGGSGWFFINPTQTKSIIHSMNRNTQYKEWSETNLGQANFSFRDINRIGFMDRISLLDGISLYNQIIQIKKHGTILFSFLDYVPIEVKDVFLFQSNNVPLIRLTQNDYVINQYKFILNSSFTTQFNNQINNGGLTLSISYNHRPQFHIIDINRDTMAAKSIENKQDNGIVDFPISAIGRRAHYVLNRQNFEGDLYIDNSYIQNNCIGFNIGGLCIMAPITTQNNCTSSAFGQVIYDINTNNFMYYNGSVWITLGNINNNNNIKLFTFTNSDTVTCTHNLGRIVNVSIYDMSGNEIDGTIVLTSLNITTITFTKQLSGKIIIS